VARAAVAALPGLLGPAREQLCDPGRCPDAPDGEHERCGHCPLNRPDAAQLTDTGQSLRRALDLRSALSMGIRIGPDEIDADEFFAMQVVEQERGEYGNEVARRERS